MIDIADITGLVLAGGRGSRMGGVDKGLQAFRGTPLAQHALRRLAPQVGSVAVNANRNLPAYQALGVPVWVDPVAGQPGPLAGIAAGLAGCATPYLATVPCDSPDFPFDLVKRLAGALTRHRVGLAMAAVVDTDGLRPQPVFCLVHKDLADRLYAYLREGGRKVGAWAKEEGRILVPFDDPRAFANLNSHADLATRIGEA